MRSLEAGSKWIHYRNGKTYTVIGFSTHNSNDASDGEYYVVYQDPDGLLFTTPAERFLGEADCRDFSERRLNRFELVE